MGQHSDGRSSSSPPPSSRSLGNASFAQLLSAREALQQSLAKSRSLGDAWERTGPRLQRISKRMPSLQAAIAPLRTHKKVMQDLGTHIDKAVEPAAAVLKVFDAVHGLENSLLSDPQCDLGAYIGLTYRLEEAVSFLSENCYVAIQWLQEMVDFLEKNRVLEDGATQRLTSHIGALKAWQASGQRSMLDGGLLDAAFDRLELEFKRILAEFSVRIAIPASAALQKSNPGKPAISVSSQALKQLQSIVHRLASMSSRMQKCVEFYIEARCRSVKASMQSLQLDYLQFGYAELGSKLEWQPLEAYIAPWMQHIEVVVKLLFEPEHQLCHQVFEKLGSDVAGDCFGRIAVRGGMLEFLQFGETVARSRNEPRKLFKLLEMFEAMNNLRPSFTKVFGGTGCKEVQQRTRELLKQVVQGSFEIFLELKQQVELQRDAEPPMDGSVPRVSSFVVGYVKHLVGDFYGPIITQVLAIQQSWKAAGKPEDRLLSKAVLTIMQALEQNFREWAKCFKDLALFHLFLMNNYWYLNVNCKVTELRLLVGDSWLREQQQQAEHHATLYLKDGWGKAIQHLSIEGVLVLTGSRAGARDLLKRRLKAFNAAFDDLYQRHSKWSVPDAEMREKTCLKVVKVIVPAYRTYIQSYGPLMEQDGSPSKYAKYTAQTLERMLGNLFQGRPDKIVNGTEKNPNGSNPIARPSAVRVT